MITKAHLLFEQSGTFKNEFIKHNISAIDYDISNKFNQTDYVIDLFSQIHKAFNTKDRTIFDQISPSDIVIAFFPCTKFDEQIKLWFRGDAYSMKDWSEIEKLTYDLLLHNQLHENYVTLTELALIAYNRNLKLIIENPYSRSGYLSTYWCHNPAIIHKDRRVYGDYYKKPTQFFFFNAEPKDNDIPLPKDNGVGVYQPMVNMSSSFYQNGATNKFLARSMIAPDYAKYFIEQYIL